MEQLHSVANQCFHARAAQPSQRGRSVVQSGLFNAPRCNTDTGFRACFRRATNLFKVATEYNDSIRITRSNHSVNAIQRPMPIPSLLHEIREPPDREDVL